MLERSNMICSKCGSGNGTIELVTDPTLVLDGDNRYLGYLLMSAECDNFHQEEKWVHVQTLWNLLRSVCIADRATRGRISVLLGSCPSKWKLWRMGDACSANVLSRRKTRVREALCVALPSIWTWFNGPLVVGSISARDWESVYPPSRSFLRSWQSSRLSLPEWQSLWVALLKSPKRALTSPDVARFALVTGSQPLAS